MLDFVQFAKGKLAKVEFNCCLSISWYNHFKLILVTFFEGSTGCRGGLQIAAIPTIQFTIQSAGHHTYSTGSSEQLHFLPRTL